MEEILKINSELNLYYLNNLIINKSFKGNFESEESKEFLEKFEKAYEQMGKAFKGINRKGKGEVPYFEHLKGVAKIYLEFFDDIDREAIIVAILHDSIEDIEEINYDLLKDEYGENIAIAVLAISKKEKKDYLGEYNKTSEIKITEEKYEKLDKEGKKVLNKELKELRNEDYFGHMLSFDLMKEYVEKLLEEKNIVYTDEKLEKITRNVVKVKCADRLHNLTDMLTLLEESDDENIENNIKFVNRKLEESKKYFDNIIEEIGTEEFRKEYNYIKIILEKEIVKLKTHSVIN